MRTSEHTSLHKSVITVNKERHSPLPLVDKFESEFCLLLSGVTDIGHRTVDIIQYGLRLRLNVFPRDVIYVRPPEVLTNFYLDSLEFLAYDNLPHQRNDGLNNHRYRGVLTAGKNLQRHMDHYLTLNPDETDLEAYNKFLQLVIRAGGVVIDSLGDRPSLAAYSMKRLGGLAAERQVVQGILEEGIPARYSTMDEDSKTDTDVVVTINSAIGEPEVKNLQVKSQWVKEAGIEPLPLKFDTTTIPPTVTVRRAEGHPRLSLSVQQRQQLIGFVVGDPMVKQEVEAQETEKPQEILEAPRQVKQKYGLATVDWVHK